MSVKSKREKKRKIYPDPVERAERVLVDNTTTA